MTGLVARPFTAPFTVASNVFRGSEVFFSL